VNVDNEPWIRPVQDETIRNVRTNRVQIDQFRNSFTRRRRTSPRRSAGRSAVGDVWTWVAIDADAPWFPIDPAANDDQERGGIHERLPEIARGFRAYDGCG
jgi:hypothetical protein